MTKWYLKELPDQLVYLPDGKPIALDFISVDEVGFVATENGYLKNQLDKAVASHVGGWLETTELHYNEELKKKQASPPSLRGKRKSPTAWLSFPNNPPVAGLVAEAKNADAVAFQPPPKPEPLKVPTPEQLRPRTGKASQLRVAA